MVVGGVGGSSRGHFLFPFRHRKTFRSAPRGGAHGLVNREEELLVLQNDSEGCVA
jgi:hypothetical protein